MSRPPPAKPPPCIQTSAGAFGLARAAAVDPDRDGPVRAADLGFPDTDVRSLIGQLAGAEGLEPLRAAGLGQEVSKGTRAGQVMQGPGEVRIQAHGRYPATGSAPGSEALKPAVAAASEIPAAPAPGRDSP